MEKDINQQPREYPPPYSELPGGPPPPGFVETTQQPPPYSIQSIPIQQPIPNNNQQYPINYTTSSGQTYVTVAAATHSPPVVLMGGCPACRVGILRDTPTLAGIFLCLILFPIGILCLFCLMERSCSHCGARF